MKHGQSWLFCANLTLGLLFVLTCTKVCAEGYKKVAENETELNSGAMFQNDTDYDALLPQTKTCAGACGLYKLNLPTDICQCDSLCFYHNDCCPGMETDCPDIIHDATIPKTQCRGFHSIPFSKSAVI